MKGPQASAAGADVSLMRRSAWTRGRGRRPGSLASGSRRVAGGAAWIVRDWDSLPRPVLALVGLAVAAALRSLLVAAPDRAKGLAEAVTAGVVALLLVGLNGGAGSPLVALWLSVLGGICLALPPLVRVQLPTLLASGAAVGTDPGTTAIPLMLGAGAVAAGSFVVSRRYAQALDQAQLESLQDPLTGLPNRRALDHRLAALDRGPLVGAGSPLGRPRRVPVHQQGPRVRLGRSRPCPGGQVLWRAAPPGSFPARLGGDEFAIVLEDRGQATELADLRDPRAVGRDDRGDDARSLGRHRVPAGARTDPRSPASRSRPGAALGEAARKGNRRRVRPRRSCSSTRERRTTFGGCGRKSGSTSSSSRSSTSSTAGCAATRRSPASGSTATRAR